MDAASALTLDFLDARLPSRRTGSLMITQSATNELSSLLIDPEL
jgi:hypothetical protein